MQDIASHGSLYDAEKKHDKLCLGSSCCSLQIGRFFVSPMKNNRHERWRVKTVSLFVVLIKKQKYALLI